jgi:hypothetical protein
LCDENGFIAPSGAAYFASTGPDIFIGSLATKIPLLTELGFSDAALGKRKTIGKVERGLRVLVAVRKNL